MCTFAIIVILDLWTIRHITPNDLWPHNCVDTWDKYTWRDQKHLFIPVVCSDPGVVRYYHVNNSKVFLICWNHEMLFNIITVWPQGLHFGGQLKWAVFTRVCHLPEWPKQSLGLDSQSRVDKFANKSGNFLVLCINSKPNTNVSIFETIRFKFFDFNHVA